MVPKILQIYTSPDKGLPMQFCTHARVLKGLGIESDRYALQKGSWMAKGETVHKKKRNVTFLAIESVTRANRFLLDRREQPYHSRETRRNIITVGIELNELIGKKFRIGSAEFLGVEHAAPCDRPDKLCGKKLFEEAFADNGGLNAEVLESGTIVINTDLVLL